METDGAALARRVRALDWAYLAADRARQRWIDGDGTHAEYVAAWARYQAMCGRPHVEPMADESGASAGCGAA